MDARISKISLTIFAVLLVLSFGMSSLAVAGNSWPCFAIMAFFAIVPVMAGPRNYRFAGAIALALSVAMLAMDLTAGKLLRERIHRSPPTSRFGTP
jgi:hypothetical protein